MNFDPSKMLTVLKQAGNWDEPPDANVLPTDELECWNRLSIGYTFSGEIGDRFIANLDHNCDSAFKLERGRKLSFRQLESLSKAQSAFCQALLCGARSATQFLCGRPILMRRVLREWKPLRTQLGMDWASSCVEYLTTTDLGWASSDLGVLRSL